MVAPARSAWSLRRLETVGAVGVLVAGTLMHFAYDWSGRSPVVAALAPASESVWEHLKMVLLPVVVLGALEMRRVADRRRLWWAKLVETVAACGFIVAFFYTYTGALGVGSVLALDIVSFVAAIAGGQWLSHRILTSTTSRPAPTAFSLAALGLLVAAFAVLTFVPPALPLFEEGGRPSAVWSRPQGIYPSGYAFFFVTA